MQILHLESISPSLGKVKVETALTEKKLTRFSSSKRLLLSTILVLSMRLTAMTAPYTDKEKPIKLFCSNTSPVNVEATR